MTKLMKQLQKWANEGWYDWDNYTFYGASKERIIRMAERYTIDQPLRYIKDVLDGTIQVWRPVEYYPPRDSTKVLGFNSKLKKALPCYVEQRYFDDVNGCIYPLYSGVYTHWQHLPPPPQKGGE